MMLTNITFTINTMQHLFMFGISPYTPGVFERGVTESSIPTHMCLSPPPGSAMHHHKISSVSIRLYSNGSQVESVCVSRMCMHGLLNIFYAFFHFRLGSNKVFMYFFPASIQKTAMKTFLVLCVCALFVSQVVSLSCLPCHSFECRSLRCKGKK